MSIFAERVGGSLDHLYENAMDNLYTSRNFDNNVDLKGLPVSDYDRIETAFYDAMADYTASYYSGPTGGSVVT